MTEKDEHTTPATPSEVPSERTERAWPPEKEASAEEGTPPPETAAPAEPDKPSAEDRIATLETEKQELRDRMLRIAAEFENYKKRARREQSEGENKGREAVLRDLLEVLDNLERATAAFSENADLKGIQEGIALVLRQFQSKLDRYDVKPLEAKGQPFDPRVHDAISRVPTDEVPAGTIISELQKGYKVGDRLLRPAAVVVAAPPAKPESAASPEGAGVPVDLDAGEEDDGGGSRSGKS